MAQLFDIAANKRDHPIIIVGPDDFELSGQANINPSEVAGDRRYSLYCFDFEQRQAHFVWCEDPDALERAPFYYQQQAESALRLAKISFDEFHRFSHSKAANADNLILIHSVGRCGSTLLSKVLQALPGVTSLSEPDELTQLTRAWVSGEIGEEEAANLLKSACLWRSSSDMQVALKFRAEVCGLHRFFAQAFPSSKHVFMYRDGLSWMKSWFRGWPDDVPLDDPDRNKQAAERWSSMVALVGEYAATRSDLNPVQIRMLAWISSMEAYLDLKDAGVPIVAIRYEDLTANPEPLLRKLLSFCGITPSAWNLVEDVLAKDSQAGTMFDREERSKKNRQLTPELARDVLDLVADRPRLQAPDVVLPGTL